MSIGDLDRWWDIKADGDKWECQVCEEGRTAWMAYNEISSVNIDTECMGGRELAYVEKICSENEVHVFALGQSSKATATDSDQHSSLGFFTCRP